MVNTIDEARTPSELVEWLRLWANGYEDGDALDDNDARQIADAVERVCAPCNAAALREAMHQLSENLLNRIAGICPNLTDEGLLLLVDKALAAPARNCDVGTAQEQIDRFHEFCHSNQVYIDEFHGYDCRPDCPIGKIVDRDNKFCDNCWAAWAQMPFAPAEGGKE